MKLGVDDEIMRPKPISGPPPMRLCQLWVTTPVKVPEEKLVTCAHVSEQGGPSHPSTFEFTIHTALQNIGKLWHATCTCMFQNPDWLT